MLLSKCDIENNTFEYLGLYCLSGVLTGFINNWENGAPSVHKETKIVKRARRWSPLIYGHNFNTALIIIL